MKKLAAIIVILAAVVIPTAVAKPKPYTPYATIALRANNCPSGPTVSFTLRTPWGDLYRAVPGGCPASTSSTQYWPAGNYVVQAVQCSGHSLWWSPWTWFQVLGNGYYHVNVYMARLSQFC